MNNPYKEELTKCLRAYILADKALRNNDWSWKSFHPDPKTPEGIEYYRLQDEYQKASSDLWMITDCEYNEDGFYDIIWNWRYWKVMARKCCWSQKGGSTKWAGETMSKMSAAYEKLVEVCGLLDIYKSSCEYIQERFPNLKKHE